MKRPIEELRGAWGRCVQGEFTKAHHESIAAALDELEELRAEREDDTKRLALAVENIARVTKERDDAQSSLQEAYVGVAKERDDFLASAARIAKERDGLREALKRLWDEQFSDNTSTHDGWHITNPRWELPKDVEELVRAALAPSPAESPAEIDLEKLRTAAAGVLGLCNFFRGKGVYTNEVEAKFCRLSDVARLTVTGAGYRPAESPAPVVAGGGGPKIPEWQLARAQAFDAATKAAPPDGPGDDPDHFAEPTPPPEKTYTREDPLSEAALWHVREMICRGGQQSGDFNCSDWDRAIRTVDRLRALATPSEPKGAK